MARDAVRHVRPLGAVSLQGNRDRLVAGRRATRASNRAGTRSPSRSTTTSYKEFNPTKFDADEWMTVAKDAGMRYFVFTTKHHDGFCNFDSKLTDYKITNPESPYGKDIVRQLADACHKAGLALGWYYSPPDWYDANYRNGDRHARYIEYMHGQVREILGNYGRVDIMWFDGLGGTAEDWDAPRLVRTIRQLQPHIVINNRCGLPADHDTPEQRDRRIQSRSTLGDVHDDLPAVGMEAGRSDEVIEAVHSDVAAGRGRGRQSAVQRGPDARRANRATPGRAPEGDGPVAGRVRRWSLRHARRAFQAGPLGRIDLQGRQDLPVRDELARPTNPCSCLQSARNILSARTRSDGEAVVAQSDTGILIALARVGPR